MHISIETIMHVVDAFIHSTAGGVALLLEIQEDTDFAKERYTK